MIKRMLKLTVSKTIAKINVVKPQQKVQVRKWLKMISKTVTKILNYLNNYL